MKKSLMGCMAACLLIAAGCSSKSATSPTVSEVPAPAPATAPVATTPTGYGFDQWQNGPLGDVFYEFDSSDLSADAQQRLKANADWMGANTASAVVIEGHCDNRGTSEYNLALGERRAATAKEYITRLGVSPSRIETVSYGEERPFATGDNEESWSSNRRAHFVVK